MGYSSQGRKPIERASKISHAEVINSPAVKEFVARCMMPTRSSGSELGPLLLRLDDDVDTSDVRAVIAIDGGFTEAPVRDEFPFASIAFYTFGPLLLEMADLRDVEQKRFIAPEDIAKLKRLERYNFVLPLRGIRLSDARSLSETVRRSIYEFFCERKGPEQETLIETLAWFLFRKWDPSREPQRQELEWCPNEDCAQQKIQFDRDSPHEISCLGCGRSVYLTDVFRLHERVDEEQGSAAIAAYVMGVLEQMVLVHLIKSVLEIKPSLLGQILFIKDGPLAFFGLVAPLCRPMRELTTYLLTRSADGASSRLRVVGLEKSGAFVEHARAIQESVPPGSFLICSNEYIYRYIVPGDSLTAIYGSNTYYGQKVIFRARTGEMHVATIPSVEYSAAPSQQDIPFLAETLTLVGALRCSMYENALVPIALVNKLVSLSDFPSQRILTTFARNALREK